MVVQAMVASTNDLAFCHCLRPVQLTIFYKWINTCIALKSLRNQERNSRNLQEILYGFKFILNILQRASVSTILVSSDIIGACSTLRIGRHVDQIIVGSCHRITISIEYFI